MADRRADILRRALTLSLAALLLFLSAHAAAQSSVKGDGFSRSPLGYAAFIEFLRSTGYEVDQLTTPLGLDFDEDDVVLLIDPTIGIPMNALEAEMLAAYMESPATIVVAAPKRVALLQSVQGGTLLGSGMLRVDEVSIAVALLQLGAHVDRTEDLREFEGWPLIPDVSFAQYFSYPSHETPYEALLGEPGRAFVVRNVRENGAPIYYVADAEVFSNHGLGSGDNARIVEAVMAHAAKPGARVYFDEAFHGYASRYSVLRAAGSFPGILVTLAGVAFAGLALWRGLGRLRRRARHEVVVDDHATSLAAATGGLLADGLPPTARIQRYREVVVQSALARTGGLREGDEAARIARLESARRTTTTLSELDARLAALPPRPSARERSRLAHAYRQWFTEVTDESA